MDWLKNITNAVSVAVIAGVIGAWLGGVFNEFVWSPGRTLLGATNVFRAKQGGPRKTGSGSYCAGSRTTETETTRESSLRRSAVSKESALCARRES